MTTTACNDAIAYLWRFGVDPLDEQRCALLRRLRDDRSLPERLREVRRRLAGPLWWAK